MSETVPDQRLSPRRRSSVMMIVAAVMAILLILAAVIGFFVYHNNQVAQDHVHATATAVQTLADNHATATIVEQQNVEATATAIPALTATAVATSPYAPFTMVSLDDVLISTDHDWSNGSTCQMTSKGYQVSVTRASYIDYCTDAIDQYNDMAYRVMMTIRTGDCGGLIFGFNDGNNYYTFEVCQDGTYDLYSHLKGEWISLYPYFRASTAIRQGLNAQNSVAITVNGKIINLYVNGKEIDTAKDFDLTGAPVRTGEIGLLADNRGDTTSVTYTNALVWLT
jgi:hypothetical protein